MMNDVFDEVEKYGSASDERSYNLNRKNTINMSEINIKSRNSSTPQSFNYKLGSSRISHSNSINSSRFSSSSAERKNDETQISNDHTADITKPFKFTTKSLKPKKAPSGYSSNYKGK